MTRELWPGRPFPLGPVWDGQGTNFSLFSEHAERVTLCLFDGDAEEQIEVRNQTAHNWHVYLPGCSLAMGTLNLTGSAFDFAFRPSVIRSGAVSNAFTLPRMKLTVATNG